VLVLVLVLVLVVVLVVVVLTCRAGIVTVTDDDWAEQLPARSHAETLYR
jgi:hypothetical protein